VSDTTDKANHSFCPTIVFL